MFDTRITIVAPDEDAITEGLRDWWEYKDFLMRSERGNAICETVEYMLIAALEFGISKGKEYANTAD